MVIIEIKREFDSFDHLLGEHRWIDFLKNPSEEEREIVTQVFYCTYNSGRQVQKHGKSFDKLQESDANHIDTLYQAGKGLMLKRVGSEIGAQSTSQRCNHSLDHSLLIENCQHNNLPISQDALL